MNLDDETIQQWFCRTSGLVYPCAKHLRWRRPAGRDAEREDKDEPPLILPLDKGEE